MNKLVWQSHLIRHQMVHTVNSHHENTIKTCFNFIKTIADALSQYDCFYLIPVWHDQAQLRDGDEEDGEVMTYSITSQANLWTQSWISIIWAWGFQRVWCFERLEERGFREVQYMLVHLYPIGWRVAAMVLVLMQSALLERACWLSAWRGIVCRSWVLFIYLFFFYSLKILV